MTPREIAELLSAARLAREESDRWRERNETRLWTALCEVAESLAQQAVAGVEALAPRPPLPDLPADDTLTRGVRLSDQ